MKTCEFTGKTTQEAIDQGLSELGVTIADVRVEVLQEGAKGLFGRFGSRPAKVRITVFEEEKEEDGGLSDLLGSFSLDSNTKKPKAKPQQTRTAEPKKPEKKPAPAPTPAPQAAPTVSREEPKKAAEPAPAAPKAAEVPVKAETPVAEPKTETPKEEKPVPAAPIQAEAPAETEPDASSEAQEAFAPEGAAHLFPEESPAGKAQRFLMELTKRMNVSVEVYADDSQPGAIGIHMIGDTLGILIGRRGETLDAIQYLTSLQVNKGQDEYIRVTVDSENYRAKREDSLRRLALRMANRAQKTGRRVVLEPMNPYERRVLHTTLQNHPAVTTHSEGEEPNRHVVITLRSQQSAAKPENREKNPGEGRSRKRGRRRPSKKGNAALNAPEMNEEGTPSVIEIIEEGTEE
ncbi:MAG: protein jag [Clostridia bacterium]|nr:protein jag [Clostridia bacterium]